MRVARRSIGFAFAADRALPWLALGALAVLPCPPAGAADSGPSHAAHSTANDAHRLSSHSKRSVRSYTLPDLTLVDMHGERVTLAAALRDDMPVVLNFIFTTCSSVCPVMSATFAEARRQLAAQGRPARMVSVTIDPEHDTPERLRSFAGKHQADSGWTFLTGRPADIAAVQRAFDTFRGNKMSHAPATFVRASPASERWVRLDGFTSAAELIAEVQRASDR
jgi:protein SCO1/2